MSNKNIMLFESSAALLLSTVRILANEHFLANDSTQADALSRGLVQQNE